VVKQKSVCPKGQYRSNDHGDLLRPVEPIHWVFSMTIHQWVANGAKMLSTQESKPCRDLVEQAEKLALADVDEPLHISALCRALKVSERTLRKAFHKAYGLPPCRHLRMLRLSEARRALLSADCELTTVTEVAMCFGFVELGRFSVEYRKVFGESPSHTLCRASHAKTFAAASGTTGQGENIGFGA
jgi:transcriptional regulator GlxA family with amidase domain